MAVAMALGASNAWALGLGNIEVRSALNEPLNAEILLTASDAEEIASLEVKLATPEQFERVGLRRGLLVVPLEFAVGRNERGQPVIKVTSKAPVRDPFLTVLIDAQWTGGRMLREYTMLLDPPLTAPAVRGTAAAAPARLPEPEPARVEPLEPSEPGEPAPRRDPPAERPRPVTEPSRPAATPSGPAGETVQPAPAFAADEYGPVAEGETLWVIATQTRPEGGGNINQMMTALFRANPEAFIQGNINLLRRGAVLRIPSADEVRATSAAEAAELVARHTEQWRESRGMRALPRVEPSDTAALARTPSRESSAAAPREDRLAILPPGDERRDTAGASRPGVQTDSVEIEGLRADLSRSRETLAAAEQEVRELRERVRELENLQSSQDRLLELKDSELAQLQQRLADLEALTESAREAERDPFAVTDETDIDEETTPADDVATTDPFQLLDPPRPAPVETAPIETGPEPEATQPEAATEPEPEPVSRPAPAQPSQPPAPWYSSPFVLGGAAVLMAVVLALVARRRRGSGGARAEGGGNLASRLVAASGSAAAAAPKGADALAGMRRQVEEDPTDLGAHLALLRHHFEQGDAENFEVDAEAMSAYVTDTAAPEWDEVRMMGAEIAPEHPLFRDPSASPVAEAEPDFAEAFDFSDGESEVDFSSGDEAVPAAGGTEPFSIDLSLGEDDAPTGRDQAQAAEPSSPRDSYSTQEFEKVDLDSALAGADDGGGLSLDGGGEDAVGTKLDLAREYLDLGDPEGARSLLEEVLKEGSSAQKAEAQRLMVQLR